MYIKYKNLIYLFTEYFNFAWFRLAFVQVQIVLLPMRIKGVLHLKCFSINFAEYILWLIL